MTTPDLTSASWYWREIDETAAAWWSEHPDDPTGGPMVQDLITQAIYAGVTAHLVPVGDAVSVPLHDLIACYRTRPGGLAERTEEEKSFRLNRPYGGPLWSAGW